MYRIKDSNNLIAYFSMEVGIDPLIPTYSGGLGILAGDTLRSFADLGLPVVAITLLSEYGYFKQEIVDEQQTENYQRWAIEKYLEPLNKDIAVQTNHGDIHLHLWQYSVTGIHNHRVPIIYLDSNHESNQPEFRKLTQRLYPTNPEFRFLQEIVLGIGGVKALDALNHRPAIYHLNEGHSALLTVELLKRAFASNHPKPLDKVRQQCVFTTHTPVPAGHDRFTIELVKRQLAEYNTLIKIPQILDDTGELNMTSLALSMSDKVNGVAKKHAEVSRKMFPNHQITSITNGVHHRFWTSPSFYELFDKYVPGWHEDPFSLYAVMNVPNEAIEIAHQVNKDRLIHQIAEMTSTQFDPNIFTIGYARRMTRYKRPDLIFYDIDKLKEIAQKQPIQLVFAGKAHPEDRVGKSLTHELLRLEDELRDVIRIVFLPNYDLDLAKLIIPGVDLWLNTPKRPLEASGTSGMKASLNGVPNFSVLDGWWLEGHIEGITGWAIGPQPKLSERTIECIDCDDSADLYNKLENIILPMYYQNKEKYSQIRKQCIALHGSYFNTHRMVQQYLIKSYLG